MLRPALAAVAPEARGGGVRRRSALGAEAMAPVPVEERLRHGQNAELLRRHETLNGCGAQIRHDEIRIDPEQVRSFRRRERADDRALAERAEEYLFMTLRHTRQVARSEQRGGRLARPEDRDIAGDEDRRGARVLGMPRERRGIALGAVAQERVPDVGEHRHAAANSAAARSTRARAAWSG